MASQTQRKPSPKSCISDPPNGADTQSMSSNANSLYDNLFSSLISDIRSYNGNDNLLPWLRGMRKMKETLPPQLLKEKLPRFLQKCAETFLNDRRYSNDLRYLRVWLQLMDFVDDPKAVLRTMEMNRIGMKKSLFYQAYALYYEKMKKFDAAEKIYHLGVQNLAEPADELQKSYEQFLQRVQRHKNKRLQARISDRRALNRDEGRYCKEDSHRPVQSAQTCTKHVPETQPEFDNTGKEMVPSQSSKNMPMEEGNMKKMSFSDQPGKKALMTDSGIKVEEKQDENRKYISDDTVVVKFVDTAIIGKSNAEDARHHGLVEPTINTREAMNAINSMFQQPLETYIAGRARQGQSKTGNSSKTGFEVYSDEAIEVESRMLHQNPPKNPSHPISERPFANPPLDEPFEIYVDNEEINDVEEKFAEQGLHSSHASVFGRPNDLPSECSKSKIHRRGHQAGLREDTVVSWLVGSTISDGPEVENVWHHGLVEPTINFKEAMNDINSMFGKPIEYARKSRSRKHDKAPDEKNNCAEFMILPDDEPEAQTREDGVSCLSQKPQSFASSPMNQDKEPNDVMNNHSGFLILPDNEVDNEQERSLVSSSIRNGSDLFEKTICTKEAIAEINKLFAMPMDF